jgi:hypothetical protein
MYFLVYVSSAVNLFSDEDLIQLLEVSRRNNEKAEITGLLLYSSGNFMQTLEGPEKAVLEGADFVRSPSYRSDHAAAGKS